MLQYNDDRWMKSDVGWGHPTVPQITDRWMKSDIGWGHPTVPQIMALDLFARVGGLGRSPIPGAEEGSGGQLWSGFTPNKFAYVTNLGTGSGNSEANAQEIFAALAGLGPDDILGLLPGIYASTATSSDRYQPVFAPANTGTSGHPIRICAKYPAAYMAEPSTDSNRSEFRITGTSVPPYSGGVDTSVCLGAREGHDYIEWYGVYSDQVESPPWPSGGTWGACNDTSNLRFEDCAGDMHVWDHGENYPMIFASNSLNLTVKNCRFRYGNDYGFGAMPVITMYGCRGFLFSHCHLYQTHGGFFCKGDVSGSIRNDGVVEYCLFVEVRNSCLEVNVATHTPGAYPILRFCLTINCGMSIDVDDAGTADPTVKRFRCYNNTFIGPSHPTGAGIFPAFLRNQSVQISEAEWYNNICYSNNDTHTPYFFNVSGHLASDTTLDTTGFTVLNNNCYRKTTGTPRWSTNGTTYTSLSAWKTAVQAEMPTQETASIDDDPEFEDVGSGNYRLQSSSPCVGTGIGGVNMGCYLTGDEEIGVEA